MNTHLILQNNEKEIQRLQNIRNKIENNIFPNFNNYSYIILISPTKSILNFADKDLIHIVFPQYVEDAASWTCLFLKTKEEVINFIEENKLYDAQVLQLNKIKHLKLNIQKMKEVVVKEEIQETILGIEIGE